MPDTKYRGVLIKGIPREIFMGGKMEKEKLLKWVGFWFTRGSMPGNEDEEEQAYLQMRTIIKKLEVTEENKKSGQ